MSTSSRTTTSAKSGALVVADSFRVRRSQLTGRAEVRGLGRHLARFRAQVRAELGEEAPESRGIDAYLRNALARIEDFGPGWPRLELWREGDHARLNLTLRPLPPLDRTLELRSAAHVGVQHAARKGPNIERYSALNRELQAEALLTDHDGQVLEGATTSLVWWQCGRESQGGIVRSLDRVPSITEALLAGAALRAGGNTRRLNPSRVTPADLQACEVWAVNALHGIRLVTSIDGAPLGPPLEARLSWFRTELDRTWEPVSAQLLGFR